MKHKLLLVFFTITFQLFSQNINQPIGFKENKGQIINQEGHSNNAVKYLLNSEGLNVQLRKNGFSYDVYEVRKNPTTSLNTSNKLPYKTKKKDKNEELEYSLEYLYHRIDIDFVNSNPKVELITDQKSTDFDNYYNVLNKPEGIIGVHQYKQITYKSIYPNIDVVFSIPKDPKKVVEYNFVVHPKGKISDIKLKFSGAKTDLVDNKIRMSVRFGEMEETLPASWIEDEELKKEIVVGYTKIKNNVYGFESVENVSDKTVVIDPIPTRLWGTFYGNQTNNHYALVEVSISTDSSGNVYMAGTTTASNSSYATTGAHQTSIASNSYPYLTSNGIIVKFDPNGNRLWGTYYGGEGLNTIKDIKTDYQNNVIITGNTQSKSNISTSGTHKTNLTDDSDAFLVKFNNSGLRLWGTYFGGETSDSANALSFDINNNIYIVGSTSSKTNIAINSNFQTQLNDGSYKSDGFLSKFTADGNLIWSTYVGGEGQDILKKIAIKDNYLVTAGDTYSFNNISTSGVFQESHNPISHPDGFICKFSLNGQRLWSTYYGGEQVDEIYSLEVDDEDNIYIGGQTASVNNITTSGSFESSSPYLYKGFVAKLNTNGGRLWGTYIADGTVSSIVFKNNSIYIGSNTSIPYASKLTSSCSYKKNENLDDYIGKFSKDGDFIWGTFVGNGFTGRLPKIALSTNNSIFIGGISYQNDGITDSSSYQPNILGTENYYIMKFSEDNNIKIPEISSNSPICIGESIELKASGGTNYLWTGPNGFTSTDQNPTIPNAAEINSGEYSCLITGTGSCDDTKKINIVIGSTPSPTANTNQTFCSGQNPTLNTVEVIGTSLKWYDSATLGNLLTATTPLSNGKTYYASQTLTNCESPRFGVTISIVNTPTAPTVNGNQAFCKSQNATLDHIQISGQNIKWYESSTSTNILPNTTLLENNKTYYASQTVGCESARTAVSIQINDVALPTGSNSQLFCIDENATIANLNLTGNNLKWYNLAVNGNISPESTLQNGVYYATQTLNNCESERYAVTVKIQDTQIPIADSPQVFCIQKNALIRDITIMGQNIKWYDSYTSSVSLSESTLLANGITYYASQIINNCESERIPVTINILEATIGDCINLVDELPFPKFFTPNNDGYNDTWTIDFAYLAPKSTIRIFDRYGKLIKELTPDTSWDGTYQNLPLPSTDYWFVVTRLSGTEFRAHFSLKR